MLHQCRLNWFVLLHKKQGIFTSFDFPRLFNKSTDLPLNFSNLKCVYEINQTCGDNKNLTPLRRCYLLGSFSNVITSTITELSMLAKFETGLLKLWVFGKSYWLRGVYAHCCVQVHPHAMVMVHNFSWRPILMRLTVRHQGEKKGPSLDNRGDVYGRNVKNVVWQSGFVQGRTQRGGEFIMLSIFNDTPWAQISHLSLKLRD